MLGATQGFTIFFSWLYLMLEFFLKILLILTVKMLQGAYIRLLNILIYGKVTTHCENNVLDTLLLK